MAAISSSTSSATACCSTRPLATRFTGQKKLEPAEALAAAEGFFREWIESAGQFEVNGRENAARGWEKIAAFNFHHATERYYHCVPLVLNLYSPKSHKLNFLRSQAEQLDGRLAEAWPIW